MSIIIGDTFIKQHKLFPLKDQGAIANTMLTLQMDPSSAALKLHKVDRGKDLWWSAYVNGDIRIILKRTQDGQMIVCWVDHHDAAYLWARRHTLQKHPSTGAMQLIEIPEVVLPPVAVSPDVPKPTPPRRREVPPCEKLGLTAEDLLALGTPEVWIERILAAKTKDELLDIATNHMPSDVEDLILSIAEGVRPEPPKPEKAPAKPYHSDLDKKAWWVVSSNEELQNALSVDAWDTWCVFLHPAQRAIAEKHYKGYYRVSGSAGTGKTVVALHHANYVLKEDPSAFALITTFSENLVLDLATRVKPLMLPKELERCDIKTFSDFGFCVYGTLFPEHPYVLEHELLLEFAREIIEQNKTMLPKGITVPFAVSEFERVVDARNLTQWEDYRDALRRNVRKRLSEERRRQLWDVFELVRTQLHAENKVTANEMFGQLTQWFREHAEQPRLYSHIVVDESQDLCEAELAFLVEYGRNSEILFSGDIGQRIIRYSFPWKPFGIDLRGKSKVLKINYRTTQQIRSVADRLMTDTLTDADDLEQERKGTISALSGPPPVFRQYDTPEDEIDGVAAWLNNLHETYAIKSGAIAIFVRSEKERPRAQAAVDRSVYANATTPCVIRTMFEAKGLEYQAVVIMACDTDVIPSPERIEEGGFIAGLEEIYDTERNMLYVAMTRARDYLFITSGDVPSEFVLDMNMDDAGM